MPWYNFQFTGTSAAAEDSATATIAETGTTAIALSQSIRLTDIVLSATATESHQLSIWVNGKNNLQIYTPHNLTQHRKADLVFEDKEL